MTTDKTPTPTDAEIEELARAFIRSVGSYWENDDAIPDNGSIEDFARAVLAKWGSPVVAGEPFCYVSVNKQGDITRTMKRADKWTNIPLYTTPQPTQAQAGAVDDTALIRQLVEALGRCRFDSLNMSIADMNACVTAAKAGRARLKETP